jgi:hypothetical protein
MTWNDEKWQGMEKKKKNVERCATKGLTIGDGEEKKG